MSKETEKKTTKAKGTKATKAAKVAKPAAKTASKKVPATATKKAAQKPLKGKLTKNLKTGMMVKVRSGKDKNTEAKVLRVDRKRNFVYIENVNQKVDYGDKKFGLKTEKTLKLKGIHISNVKLISE